MLSTFVRSTALFLIAGVFLFSTTSTTHADPTASGADPSYPLNHTFDGDLSVLDAGLENVDFEAAESSPGAPANADMETNRVEVGTPPTNADFETGDFTGWTTAGTTSIQSDATNGYYAKLQTSGAVTSSAFTVASDQQSFSFQGGFLSTSTSSITLTVLSGAGYSTSTLIKTFTCSGCANPTWKTLVADATAYQGQSIKVKFARTAGTVAVDDLVGWKSFPDFVTAGDVWPETESADDFAMMDNAGSVTTAAFAVGTAADKVRMEVKGINTSGLSKFSVYVLSGAGFATETTMISQSNTALGWKTVYVSLEAFKGQTIKIKVAEYNNQVGVDDIQLWDEVPDWDTVGATSGEGTTDKYATLAASGDKLISAPFTLPTDAQQLSLDWDPNGTGATQFYVEALSGGSFGTTTQLLYVSDSDQSWETLKAGLHAFAGETIKLQIRRNLGSLNIDDIAVETIVPGWQITGVGAATGSDAYGTYIEPAQSGNIHLFSSQIDLPPGYVTYYEIEYSIGYKSNSSLRADWYGNNSSHYLLFQDLKNTPADHRTKFIHVYPSVNGDGYIELYGDGIRIYSIGENIARRQAAEPFSQDVGVGIDTSTGSFSYREMDLSTAGRIPIALYRAYNAHSDRFGTLGYRWSQTYDTHLEFEGDDIGVVWGTGGEEFYEEHLGDFEVYDARVTNTLEENGDGSFTLETKTDTAYNFTSAGKLTTIVDPNDNAITLSYDGSGRLSTVEDPDGRTLTFAYDGNGRIESVTGPDSAVVEYTYDGNGDLIEVVDPEEGVRTYTYDKHRLVEAIDQEENLIFTNSYDSLNRVIQQTDAANNTIDVSYNTPDQGVTTVTDPNNNEASYYYDRNGRTTDKVDPLENVISYIYDGNGNLEKIIDPEFNEWDFTFDSNGDLTATEDPLGNPISITYNAQHLPTTVTDARGFTTYMGYDADGNLTSVTDPTRVTNGTSESAVSGCGVAGTGDGNDDDSDTFVDDGCPSTIYTYDAEGKMTSKTDAIGRTETYGYTNGNKTSMVDGNGKTWEWTYDAAGRVTSETNPEDETKEYVYDLFGRLILERNALDQETTYLFDLAGHLLMVEDDLGNQTFWDYDERGLVERKIDAAEEETHYTYDANRNMTSLTEPIRLPNATPESGASGCGAAGTGDGEDDDSDTLVDDGCPSTIYTYDDNNRLATVTDGAGGTTTYTYDDAGQLLSEEDAISRVTSYDYDDAGHLLEMTMPNEGVWAYTYDDNGNLLTETDPLLNVTSYGYDSLNRRVSVVDPLLNETEYTYDPAGQLVEVLDAELNLTSYDYDGAGRMISTTDPMLNERTFSYDDAGRRETVTDPLGRVTGYAYDDAGRLTSTSAPGSFVTTYAYDDVGRMISRTAPEGGVTTYAYDPRGLMVSTTNPLRKPTSTPESEPSGCGATGTGDGADDDSDTVIDDGCPSTLYGYDVSGRRVSMTDALGRTTDYAFDGAGRMASMTDALDGTVSFGYDLAGQQTSVTNALENTTTYTFDDLGNIATKTDPLSRVHEWVYDLVGRLDEATDARDVTVSYGYDDNGSLTDVTYPGGSVAYEYDDIGRRTQMTDATGVTVWNFDAASRVTSVGAPVGTVAYTYDDAGARETMTLPGSRTFTYDYGATTGRLESITDWESRVISFVYDDNGNRTGIERPNGVDSTYTFDLSDRLTNIVHADSLGTLQSFNYTLDAVGNRTAVTYGGLTETYTLDAVNRITAVDYPTGDDVTYEYDANGNITEMTVGVVTTTYTHDDADQLTSDGSITYDHDENGNLVEAGSDTFTYDYRNMMTSATISSTTTDYEHDGDAVRVAKETTEYLFDRESGLPMLVDDGTNAFLHEGGAIAAIDGSDDALFMLGDGLGSVRGVTDDAGDLVGSADYAVYGEARSSSGVSTLFRYTGEQFDAESGFTYLRARYLDPRLGQFLSADTVQPNAPGTQGFNLYAYVANNPMTWVDPSGHAVSFFFDWLSRPQVWAIVTMWTRDDPNAGVLLGFTAQRSMANDTRGTTIGVGFIGFSIVAWLLGCLGDPECAGRLRDLGRTIADFASSGPGGTGGPECMDPFDIADMMSTLSDLYLTGMSGNFPGLGGNSPGIDKEYTTSTSTANRLGEQWVGENYKISRDGKAWISGDGLKRYRPPQFKQSLKYTQANFDWKLTSSGDFVGDYHVKIDDRC